MPAVTSNPPLRSKIPLSTVESFDHIDHRHPATVTHTEKCLTKFSTLIGIHSDGGSIPLGEGRSQIFMLRLIVEYSQPFLSIHFQELDFRVPRGLFGLW